MLKYKETIHPITGDIMWKFVCEGLDTIGFLPLFFEKYQYEDFTLSIFDTITNKSGIEIKDVPLSDMAQMIFFIYNTEQAEPIDWIGINSISKSYVVVMPLTRGRIKGFYKVVDKQLIPLNT